MSQPSPATHWPAVLAAVAAGVAVGLNVGKVPLALPLLRSELGLSLVQAGWVSAMLTTLAVVAALGFGLAAGRVGALRMVLAGLGLGATGSLLALWVPADGGLPLLLASRFIEGAGFLAVAVAAPALVSAATAARDRRFALGVWSTMPAGAGLAMALSPLLLPSAGWRGLWALTSALLLAAALAAWWQRRWYVAAGAGGPGAAPVATLAVLRQPLPWLLALGFGLWALQHFALIVWLPTVLKEQRGLSAGWVALLTCAMLLACVPGNLLGGALVQRGVARGRLLAMAHAITGSCSLAFFLDGLSDAWRYAACVACSFCGGVMPAAVMSSSAVLAHSPRQINALQGLFMQGSQLGQFAGTPLVAALVAASGRWSSAGWVSATAALLGVVVGLLVWRIERRPAPQAGATPV